MRALEVIELTGGPFRASLPEPRPHYPAVVVGVDRTRPSSTSGSRVRVDRMWAAGLVAEVEALAPTGCARADGVPRARLRAGAGPAGRELTPDEARERTVSTTRRFVRRQRSWFRRDAATTWFDAARPDLVDAITAEIAARTIEP